LIEIEEFKNFQKDLKDALLEKDALNETLIEKNSQNTGEAKKLN
jgi:hypothetical protein